MAQESHRGFNKRRLKSGGISLGSSRNKSISGGQHCLYLSALDRDLPYNHPSSRNICRGQTSKKRKGFKTITSGYHKIDRDTQLEACLPNFGKCRYYQENQKEPIEPAHAAAETVNPNKGKSYAKSQKKTGEKKAPKKRFCSEFPQMAHRQATRRHQRSYYRHRFCGLVFLGRRPRKINREPDIHVHFGSGSGSEFEQKRFGKNQDFRIS